MGHLQVNTQEATYGGRTLHIKYRKMAHLGRNMLQAEVSLSVVTSTAAVSSTFCSYWTFPGMASTVFFTSFVTIPVAPIITGIIKHLMFHIRCISPYIYTTYSTIIIICVLITLLSIYLLGNFHISPHSPRNLRTV